MGRRAGWEIEQVGEAELSIAFDATMAEIVEAIERRRADVIALGAAGLWPPR